MRGRKPPVPPSFWRDGQSALTGLTVPNPSSRPQARRRCVSISGSGVVDPSGSPEGRALWCTPQRHGCRAEPCRCPRRTLPARAGVQRAEPSGACRKGTGAGQRPAAVREGRSRRGRESRGQSPLVRLFFLQST